MSKYEIIETKETDDYDLIFVTDLCPNNDTLEIISNRENLKGKFQVIDHHKIGDISTNNPINFRNMAVGSTNTIIYSMYNESNIDIPKDMDGDVLLDEKRY